MSVENFSMEFMAHTKAGSTSDEIIRLSKCLGQIISAFGHGVDHLMCRIEMDNCPPAKDGFPGLPAE